MVAVVVLNDHLTNPGHIGRVTMNFVADDPGDWLFH